MLRVVTIGLAALALGACADDGTSGPRGAGGDTETEGAAATYCTDSGGTVETRTPYWGTNLDQSQWIELAGSLELCMFAAPDDPNVRIYVDTVTLAAEQPSLAAAAYLARLPLDDVPAGVNPAAIDCDDIVQGTSSWGTSMSAGGWVNLDDPDFTVVNLCVFADRSAIDEWGITYAAGDVVRGADLSELFRFDSKVVTELFPNDRRGGS